MKHVAVLAAMAAGIIIVSCMFGWTAKEIFWAIYWQMVGYGQAIVFYKLDLWFEQQ